MVLPPVEKRAARRVLSAAWRLVVRALQMAFIVLMVILPVPVVALFAKPGKSARRNLPAEVLKKR